MVYTANNLIGFCGSSICSQNACELAGIFNTSTCINHILVISISILLSIFLLLNLFHTIINNNVPVRSIFRLSSPLMNLLSIAINGGLALVYLGFGVYILTVNFTKRGSTYYAPHQWLTMLSQGIYMSVVSLVFTTRFKIKKIWSIFPMLFAGFLFSSSIIHLLKSKQVVAQASLNILSLPGAVLILVIGIKQPRDEDVVLDGNLYMPLNDDTDTIPKDSDSTVTPLSTAGFFSLMSFGWLNALLQKGYAKPLEDKDIPELGEVDQARTQYADFIDRLNNQKQKSNNPASPSLLWAIISCQKRDILLSGVFALLKILTISVCPLIVNAFIKVYMGQEAFKYETHVLALGLFFAKCLESLSQRQWFFRSRRLGVRVRSLLSAAIYKKQQRLSNLAKITHSTGEIINYVTVDAYRIGEFPYWFHQIWTTSLQLCIALIILYSSVGLATVSSMVTIILTVACNAPLANLQHQFQIQLMKAQDKRLKAMSESLGNMKVLKLYAWDRHFSKVIENLRQKEFNWIKAFQLRKGYNTLLFWSSPVLVSAATFLSCYLMGVPLDPSNVFTFVATVRLVQVPIRQIPDVIGAIIQAKVAFARISRFLEAPDLQSENSRHMTLANFEKAVVMESCSFSWDENPSRPNLRNVTLEVNAGEKVAVCGEVGSGKSTVLAAILGEVPKSCGMMQVCGKIAYVPQSAWIRTGTVQENILFGSPMNKQRYQETLSRCSLLKDLEMLPFGDQTQIGERGINLSGGQKQRVQLARALYRDADIYLLDDPFSAVDAQTASSLFNDYVMGGLSEKTVLLVTHQVDFLPAFDSILLMSNGEILHSAPFDKLIASCNEFQNLVHAHEETVGQRKLGNLFSQNDGSTNTKSEAIRKTYDGNITQESTKKKNKQPLEGLSDQMISKEERASGDTGLKPYMQYLGQNKGYLFFSLGALSHVVFVTGQILQNSWMAANVQNPNVSTLKLILVYLGIGFGALTFLLFRSISVVMLGLETSKSLFSQLLSSLFHAPMGFYDSTPLGRILSRVSSDLSIVDLDVPFSFVWVASSGTNTYSILGVLAVLTWQVLFISVPVIVLAIRLQRYYLTSAKELMRINGTTKSLLTNHLSESIMGAITIRAFQEEERFFAENIDLIDTNASPFLHNFASTEWLILRLELMSAAILASSALVMALVPRGTFSSGFVGMALSYGLSLNTSLVNSIQHQCKLANLIISFERLKQYMNINSEAPEVIEETCPAPVWPTVGTVELQDLKIRYRSNTPLVLRGITCTFQGGQNIGVVGRTGSGKTTLISALFRLVEPTEGKIIVDGLDITKIGLYDLRSRFSIIPQDPTLFHGSIRYNIDPIGQFSDQQIWEVLDKCQLREAVEAEAEGLDSLVNEEGSNWSMGQRQLFCLGRALLRRSRILVLDEATASIDNSTDAILQKIIRAEFADCTVITVAHRIPTVMDCDMILAISDGKLVEYDEPMKLMNKEGSLFRELVKEYWSHCAN